HDGCFAVLAMTVNREKFCCIFLFLRSEYVPANIRKISYKSKLMKIKKTKKSASGVADFLI
ncbi:MAG: hypothetical protein PHV35_12455, partial [Mariniphaga sp.]|nr:hypothetical protein [Mariniphaga sp.]